MALSLLPMVMADWVKGLALSRYAILAVIFIIYLILGCLMDTLSMIVLTLPVIFPVVMALGFDPIWFGVLMTLLAEAALITPPVGMNVFVVAGISEGVPMETVFRGIFPFFSAMIICLVILVLFPQISLFLPGFMR
jgi:TRAP-type C4-dicarboxylate transport system permease large subunit